MRRVTEFVSPLIYQRIPLKCATVYMLARFLRGRRLGCTLCTTEDVNLRLGADLGRLLELKDNGQTVSGSS
jgi:hypothetical protein